MSKERNILNRIKTNLAAVDGSGSYTYDFSSSDSVQLGTEPVGAIPRAPGIYIFPMNLQSSRVRGKTPLNSYTRVFNVQIDVWVPRTSEAASNAILAALDAQSDVMKALELDPTLGGECYDLELDAAAYDGEAVQVPGFGVATLRVQVEYNEKRGQ
tara:strand:+ start:2783 stop:3250 length:468 start_codon:yes stop_codon:yes gene_type:complete